MRPSISECPNFKTGKCCGRKHLEHLLQLQQDQPSLESKDGKTAVVALEWLETWQDGDKWLSVNDYQEGIETAKNDLGGWVNLTGQSQLIVIDLHPFGTTSTASEYCNPDDCPNFVPSVNSLGDALPNPGIEDLPQ